MENVTVFQRALRGNFRMAIVLALMFFLATSTAHTSRITFSSRNSTIQPVISTTVNASTTAAPRNSTVPNKTTTVPSNTTTVPSNTTMVPSNTTTVPSNTTMVPSNTTTVPSNSTTVPSNTTTVPSNTTTVPSNTTTSPSNTTTAPSNTTTAPSNMTTAPSNTTTAPSNTTTAPSNMTTVTSNMTTASNYTTTQPANTTTATPTPALVTRWQVYDTSGMLCMLMDFNATITYSPESGNDITVWVTDDANTSNSRCKKTSSKFMLEFHAHDMLWQLALNFTDRGSSYILHEVSTSLYGKKGAYINAGYLKKDFFTVPSGSYYSCASFNQSYPLFTVNILNPTFQPFVQRTSTGNDLGKESVCGKGGVSSNAGKIIIGVLLTIIVICAATGLVCYIKKKRPQTQGYNRVN